MFYSCRLQGCCEVAYIKGELFAYNFPTVFPWKWSFSNFDSVAEKHVASTKAFYLPRNSITIKLGSHFFLSGSFQWVNYTNWSLLTCQAANANIIASQNTVYTTKKDHVIMRVLILAPFQGERDFSFWSFLVIKISCRIGLCANR